MAKVLNGKELATSLLEDLKWKVKECKENYGVIPGLAIIQVGERADSKVYIGMKIKNANEAGMHAKHFALPKETNQTEVFMSHLFSSCFHYSPCVISYYNWLKV